MTQVTAENQHVSPLLTLDVEKLYPTDFERKRAGFEKDLLALMEPYRFAEEGCGWYNFLDAAQENVLTTIERYPDEKNRKLKPKLVPKLMKRAGEARILAKEALQDEGAGQDFVAHMEEERDKISSAIARLIEKHYPELANELVKMGAAESGYSAILAKNLVSPELTQSAEKGFEKYGDFYSNPSTWAGFGCTRLTREGTQGTLWQEPPVPYYTRTSKGKVFLPHRDSPDSFWTETTSVSPITSNPHYVTGIIDADRAIRELLAAGDITMKEVQALCEPVFQSELPSEVLGKIKREVDLEQPVSMLHYNIEHDRFYLANSILSFPKVHDKQYVQPTADEIITGLVKLNREHGVSEEHVELINTAHRKIYNAVVAQTEVVLSKDGEHSTAKKEGFGAVLGTTDTLVAIQQPLHPNHTYHWVRTAPEKAEEIALMADPDKITADARTATIAWGDYRPSDAAKNWAEAARARGAASRVLGR